MAGLLYNKEVGEPVETRSVSPVPVPYGSRNLLRPNIPGTRENTAIERFPNPLTTPTSQNPLLMGMMGVVSPIAAKGTKFKINLPNHPEFLDAVKNTPGAEITADGLKLGVIRFQKPEQELMDSTRGGVMYLLDPKDKNLTHYRTAKVWYGGSDKITGETLVKNPLVVKGATGGKAGEVAFDTLNGKGAYKAMRQEALNATNVFGWGKQDPYGKVRKVEEFLKKYAPDRVDMADYIVENSKQGNTLPYALQEMAVHDSASKAGYDAVLGYSKRRDGSHFLSELFDLREQGYPSPEGDFRMYEGLSGE